MTEKEMIKKICEVIADKTLSFGCRILVSKFRHPNAEMINKSLEGYVEFITTRTEFDGTENGIEVINKFGDVMIINRKHKIIGHPVMIGDCLDWIEKNKDGEEGIIDKKSIDALNIIMSIFVFWKEKRKPIEEQNIDCIRFIYSLI